MYFLKFSPSTQRGYWQHPLYSKKCKNFKKLKYFFFLVRGRTEKPNFSFNSSALQISLRKPYLGVEVYFIVYRLLPGILYFLEISWFLRARNQRVLYVCDDCCLQVGPSTSQGASIPTVYVTTLSQRCDNINFILKLLGGILMTSFYSLYNLKILFPSLHCLSQRYIPNPRRKTTAQIPIRHIKI